MATYFEGSLVPSLSLDTGTMIAAFALVISLFTYFRSNRDKSIEITHLLHSLLFENIESVKVLYVNFEQNEYYFDWATRGQKGNFIGSEQEAIVDLFLERLNFTCMWLLKNPSRDQEILFRKHISRVYEGRFFQDYFSYLSASDITPKSGEEFLFIHAYASRRLGFSRPNTQFPTKPCEERI
jgi:hypothetical protein